MKISKLKLLAITGLTTIAGTSLVACGSAATKKEASVKDTLVYAGESEDTINPILNTHDELPSLIFSGLMKFNVHNEPIEDLAESHTYDADNMKYTFKLKKDVKWHDGKPFTANDVVYTYDALTKDDKLSNSVRSNYADIKQVKAIDDYTVEFDMSSYDAAMLTYFTIGILPKHICEGQDLNTTEFNQKPIGTGKYKFVNWDTTGGMITLEKNEDYYGKVPNIGKIVYKTVSVESTKATMLKAGEADFAWLNSKYAKEFDKKPEYNTWLFKTADYRGASMDMRSNFWKKNADSIGVLNYALDKDAIVKSVLLGQGATAYSPIQRNPLGTNKEADIYSYDLDKFAKEMEALGWKKGADDIYERNGDRFSFNIQTREYEEERVDIANLMSNMLKQAGVEMNVKLVSKFDWKAGYDGFLAGYATQYDPDMIYNQFVTDASGNNMHYSNLKVDEELKAGRHEKNVDARKKTYGQFEVTYAKSPGILLAVYLDGNYVGSSKLKGPDTTKMLGHHAVGVMWNIEDWSFSE